MHCSIVFHLAAWKPAEDRDWKVQFEKVQAEGGLGGSAKQKNLY